MRCLILVLLLGCGPSAKELGPLTEDGRAAIKEWCPFLEIESENENPQAARLVRKQSAEVLIFRCVGDRSKKLAEQETGFAVVDAKTSKLLALHVSIRPASFDLIANRIVRPTLDAEARRALDELKPVLERSAPGTRKDWRRGGIHIVGTVDQVYANTWILSVGYNE